MRLLFLLLFPVSLFAQFTYTIDQSIPVQVEDRSLLNPWAGGLNSAQINTMDLNADGQEDLVIFDKTASKISTFVAVKNTYVYAPEYEIQFPPDINTFLVLRDYNCDGKKDLFTFGQIGVYVYRNVTEAGKTLSWKKLTFYTAPGFKSEVLLTQGFSSKINLLPGTNDLPNFIDMDGDGDLDVLNMKFVSPSQAEFHKNFSRENGHGCDSLELVRQTQNWGGFTECSCGEIAFGNQTCEQIGGRIEQIQHTGGKATLTLDADNDGDKDLLYSEESCTDIYYLENKGDAANAVMNGLTSFPSIKPISFSLFPATYLEDVDFDGKADLLASSNLSARVVFNNNFAQSLWYYKNTGTAQAPNFSFVKNNFLQDEMIEVGDFSAPAFIDFDMDGDQDMFIGQYINSTLQGTISYYENTGNHDHPSFKLNTDDFLNLSFFSLYNIKPQFADVDKNGGPDLVFTATSLQTGTTRLYYILSSSTTAPVLGGPLRNLNVPMDASKNVTMVDIDLDGRLDLLIGTSTGSLEYWKNLGATNSFALTNDKYLGLGESPTRRNVTAAAGDLDHDGREDLVIGDQSGMISIYNDFRGPLSPPITNLIYDPFSKLYTSKNLGGSLRPVIVNLLGTDKPEIITGNELGGLYVLKNDNGVLLSDVPSITISPVPAKSDQSIQIRSDRAVSMQIYTALGQQIGNPLIIPAKEITSYFLQGLSAGLYIARFTSGSKSVAIRFIVI
ncbi:MAG: T9SS type A sorting domain-containing protein [Bacteroidota bacterium]